MNVKEAIEAAWDGADSVKQACENMLRMMENDRALYRAVMHPHEWSVVNGLIGDAKRGQRKNIWNKTVANWQRPVAPDERAKVLAQINSLTIMDMRLRSGKRLGDAMKEEVVDERDYYSKMSDHMADKARFFGIVAEKMTEKQTVAEAFKPDDLEAVRVAA
jgi:hypothetical protein